MSMLLVGRIGGIQCDQRISSMSSVAEQTAAIRETRFHSGHSVFWARGSVDKEEEEEFDSYL